MDGLREFLGEIDVTSHGPTPKPEKIIGPLDELETRLVAAGVHWDRNDEPDLDEVDGRLRLSICTSFSYDPGYSMYRVGYGSTLDECIADLHDPEET
jgi:hypothetical protein